MALNDDQYKRYARHIALDEIKEQGQEILHDARVLVIGAGGLGHSVLYYLATAGVGHIGIADGDHVDLSNLQRQFLFSSNDIGASKVETVKKQLLSVNPNANINAYPFDIKEDNAKDVFTLYDVIVDATDNFSSRFLIADMAQQCGIPLIHAAVIGYKGYVSCFMPYLGGDHPSYRCFCPEIPKGEADVSCSGGAVFAPVVGVIGALQANEVLKHILEIGEGLSGKLLSYDGLKNRFRVSMIKRQIGGGYAKI